MKYIDADLLRKEIDRQKIGYNTDGKHTAEYNTCRKILDIITSLQQEQQEADLEEEADKMFFSFGWYEGDHHQPMLDCVSLEQFRSIARHFYELGKNSK